MDNVVIQIESIATEHLPSSTDIDVELGIGREQKGSDGIPLQKIGTHSVSTERLIPPGDADGTSARREEEDEALSSKASLSRPPWHRGVLSSFAQIGSFVSTTKVFWMVVVYTIFGAYLFMWLEVQKDLEEKRKAYEYHLVVRDALLFKIEQINKESFLEKSQHWKMAILEFEQHSGFQPPQRDTSWTLWMSILYCATIYTTVGYGNIACATTGGRVATIVYAICGIPLMIVVLDQLGTFLLRKMKELSNFVDDLLFFLGVKYRLIRLEDQEAFVRYIAICRILARLRLIPSTITLSITEEDVDHFNAAKSPSSASGASNSSRPSSPDSRASSVIKICKSSSNSAAINFRERVSLRLAISRGSVLQNIGPFYVESIDVEDSADNLMVELDKQLLLTPTTVKETSKCPKQSLRRASKTSVTTVHIKLEEADKILNITPKSGEVSRKSSAIVSVHSETAPNETPQLGKAGRSPPLLIALAVTTAWIAFAAAVFCLWEEWSYFTSIYFFFISMSTIGFGDVTPQHPQYMIMTFFVEKVSLVYMDFLNKMLQQYMKAKENGDVEALKGAMAGFNDRCKYLMPFISKNQGIRIMNKFKEEAKAMGVELPEVMTELNEETGKPAFCRIFDEKSDQKVNQFLEQAQHQGKMRRNAHTQTKMPLPKTHKFFISRAEADKEEFEVQTEMEMDPKTEKGTQTATSECSDSGIQCSPIMSDEWTECVEEIGPELFDRWTSTQTQAVTTRNTGVQPEVSCIMRIIDEDESDFPLSSDYGEEEECAAALSSSGLSRLGSPADALSSQQSQLLSGSSREGELERRLSVGSKRSAQMKRVPEIELDDEGFVVGGPYRAISRPGAETFSCHGGFAPPLSPPPLVTIRMASKALTEEEIGETIKPEAGRAKKRRKMRAGLRYMKNAAVQVGSIKNMEQIRDFACQFGHESGKALFAEEITDERMERKSTQNDQKIMLQDKWAQCNILTLLQNVEQNVGTQTDLDRGETLSTEEDGISTRPIGQLRPVADTFEIADNWRSSFGVQTEFPCSRCKRTQTDRPLLVSRPAQTQLSSTFRRSYRDGEGPRGEGKAGEESEAQIEPHFENEREREEMKRVFGLESEDIDQLRERVREVKRKRREERQRRKRQQGQGGRRGDAEGMRGGNGGSLRAITSSEEDEQMEEEEKAMLIEEIRRIKKRRRLAKERRLEAEEGEEEGEEGEEEGEEEAEEEEEEEEITVLPGQKRKRMLLRHKGRGENERMEEFTLQINQPAERGHIIRENYEETILDIQLIRSPFFETRYLPQSEEQLIFDEVELKARESIKPKEKNEKNEIEKLLGKLNKLEALSAKEEELEQFESIRREIGQMSREEEEKIFQFTAESSAQTVEDGHMSEMVTFCKNNPDVAVNDLSDMLKNIDEFKQFKEKSAKSNRNKWTQTAGELVEEEQNKEGESEGDRCEKERQSLTERVVELWRGKTGIDRRKTTRDAENGQREQTPTPKMPLRPNRTIAQNEETTKKEEEAEEEAKQKPFGIIRNSDWPIATSAVQIDLSQIVLVQTQPETIEFRKIRKRSASAGAGEETETEPDTSPLEPNELAKLRELFPGLMEGFSGKEMGEPIVKQQPQRQFISSYAPSSSTQFGSSKESNKRRKEWKQQQKHVSMMSRTEGGRVESARGSGADGREDKIRLIPLVDILKGDDEETIVPSTGIQPWPIPPGPPRFGQTQLHYIRQWIEHLLELNRDQKQPQSLYDVPLRSISEFLRERRRELDELERQKQQLERLAELASREESAERMVNVSIQAGVHSRVVPILGAQDGGEGILPSEEFNYLTNPVYPIVRIPLELAERGIENSGGEKEQDEQGEGRKDNGQ
uniref:Potassium channel domain-containing protein n=1 Tax=Globodera rostochiensis TaxID=31243 RepID=A0A914HXM1_GLORO